MADLVKWGLILFSLVLSSISLWVSRDTAKINRQVEANLRSAEDSLSVTETMNDRTEEILRRITHED